MAAELKAKVTLNDSHYTAGLTKALRAGERFGKEVGSRLKGFVTGPLGAIGAAISGVFAYSAFKSGIQGALETGSALHKLQKQTGFLPGEIFSLQKAYKAAGVDSSNFAQNVGILQKNLYLASKGNSVLKSTLRELKLDLVDLLKLKPADQFTVVGKAIGGLPSQILRAGAATDLFGRSGRELLPLFDELQTFDVSTLSDQAKFLTESAESFHATSVALAQAGGKFKAVWLGMAAEVAPALRNMAEVVKKADWFGIGKTIGKTIARGITFLSSLDFGASFESLKELAGGLFDYVMARGKQLVNFLSNIPRNLTIAFGKMVKTIAGMFGPLGESIANTVDEKLEQLTKETKLSLFDPSELERELNNAISRLNIARSLQNKFRESIKTAWGNALTPDPLKVPERKEAPHQKDLLPSKGFERLGGASMIPETDLKERVKPTTIAGSRLNNENGFPFTRESLLSPLGLTGGLAGQSGKRTVESYLSRSERASFRDAAVAGGEKRDKFASPGAFNAVKFGDAKRRREFLKAEERAKSGPDKIDATLREFLAPIARGVEDISK